MNDQNLEPTQEMSLRFIDIPQEPTCQHVLDSHSIRSWGVESGLLIFLLIGLLIISHELIWRK